MFIYVSAVYVAAPADLDRSLYKRIKYARTKDLCVRGHNRMLSSVSLYVTERASFEGDIMSTTIICCEQVPTTTTTTCII